MKILAKIVLIISIIVFCNFLQISINQGKNKSLEKIWKKMNDKVITLYQQGRYSEATKVGEEALKLAKKIFEPNRLNVSQSLNYNARRHIAKGKYNEAETFHTQSVTILEKALGKDHNYVATVLEDMAVAEVKVFVLFLQCLNEK